MVSNHPLVSIIIPNYNHARFLDERMQSVLGQTYQNFEVIILDDRSTDNSREVIEKYRSNPKVRKILFNDTNSGSPFRQWKKGMELASGEIVWIAEFPVIEANNSWWWIAYTLVGVAVPLLCQIAYDNIKEKIVTSYYK